MGATKNERWGDIPNLYPEQTEQETRKYRKRFHCWARNQNPNTAETGLANRPGTIIFLKRQSKKKHQGH